MPAWRPTRQIDRPWTHAGPSAAGGGLVRALAALVLAGLISLLSTFVLAGGPGARADGDGLPCTVTHQRLVQPLSRQLGERITVSLALDLSCEPRARPLDLVLVLDASPGIGRSSLSDLKIALERALTRIDLAEGAGMRVAVLAYDDRGLVDGDLSLTGDREALLRNLRRVESGDRTCVSVVSNCGAAAALRRAAEVLDLTAIEGSRRVVVLASAGIGRRLDDPSYDPQLPCVELSQAALALRSRRDGTALMTACASDETGYCGRRCLTGKSTDDARFALLSPTSEWSPIEFALPALAEGSGDFHPVERIEIVDLLPPELEYVGGAQPGAIDGRRLSWTGFPLTRSLEISLRYWLEARNCGDIPSSEDASYTLRYLGPMWGGVIRSEALAMPRLTVGCDGVPSVPTPPSPTLSPPDPTFTATPTASPGSSPAPGPSHTATASPSAAPRWPPPLFLPFVLSQACGVEESRLPRDWVLVLDVSGSMAGAAGPPFEGASRWSASESVLRALLGAMRPGIDRTMILQYGEAGELTESAGGLMPCCGPALAELDARHLRLRNGHPWAALERARWRLETAPPAGGARRPGLVFVTDMRRGDLGASEEALMLQLTAEARAAGISIYAIALGERADARYLARWTGRPVNAVDGRRLVLPLERSLAPWLRCTP